MNNKLNKKIEECDIAFDEEKELSTSDQELRAKLASALWNKFLKDDIKKMIRDQLLRLANKGNLETLNFARGGLNTLFLLEEWFKKRESESKQKSNASAPGL